MHYSTSVPPAIICIIINTKRNRVTLIVVAAAAVDVNAADGGEGAGSMAVTGEEPVLK